MALSKIEAKSSIKKIQEFSQKYNLDPDDVYKFIDTKSREVRQTLKAKKLGLPSDIDYNKVNIGDLFYD